MSDKYDNEKRDKFGKGRRIYKKLTDQNQKLIFGSKKFSKKAKFFFETNAEKFAMTVGLSRK